MVVTERCEHRLVGALELAAELELQPLGRELDRRQRVLDLVREPARDLAPGLDALRRDQLGDVVEDHQARALRHRRAAHQQGDRVALAAVGAGRDLQLERVLPVVALAGLGAGGVQLEALPDRLREAAEARRPRRAGGRGRPRAAACRIRVAPGLTVSIAPLRSNTITPAVRLSRIVCRLARAPSTWTTLLWTSSRASESCSVISANERVRPPSSSRDANTGFELKSPRATCAHALGEQQQRLRELVAERDREQQRAEHGEHQRQRQRADVHLAQAASARARAAGTRGRRWCTASALAASVGAIDCVTTRKRSCSPSAKLLLGMTATARTRADAPPAADASSSRPSAWLTTRWVRAWRSICGGMPLGHQPRAGAAGREQRLAGAADDRDLLAPRAARAAARARAARPTTPLSPRRSAASARLGRRGRRRSRRSCRGRG